MLNDLYRKTQHRLGAKLAKVSGKKFNQPRPDEQTHLEELKTK